LPQYPQLNCPSAGKAPLLSSAGPMGDFRTIYRGYAIHVFGETPAWSFRAEPMRPELPLLAVPVQDGHDSWEEAN
jgi:hypothetical protein